MNAPEDATTTGLGEKIGSPKARFLVFTSAGNNSEVLRWVGGTRNFDLWTVHYAGGDSELRAASDYYVERADGKFPNLSWAWARWPEIFKGYDAILVIDDDIVISGQQISHLFRIQQRYGLKLLQPAFSTAGKISHRVTKAIPGSFGRYTNFVETGVALFSTQSLARFMSVYDPKINGWGVDWWYLHELRDEISGRIAVIDAVCCTNPDERMTGRPRAIDTLQSTSSRRQLWEKTAQELGVTGPDGGVRTLGSIRPRSGEDFLAVLVAPIHALVRQLLFPHFPMRMRRAYWRLAWRLKGSKDAW